MNHASEPLLREGGTPDVTEVTTQTVPAPHAAHAIALSELNREENNVPNESKATPFIAPLSHRNNPLHQLKAKLTVCIGSVELAVGDLLDAKEQQVLLLDRTVEQPVDVMLEGQVVARGTLVAVGEYFGVSITELPVSFDASLNMHTKT